MRALAAGLAGLLVLVAPAALAASPPAPPEARAQKELGDQLRKAGDAEGAVEAYRAALQRHGAYAEAYEAIGEVQFAQRRFAEAVESFGYAVEIDPGYALAWYNLGFSARKGGDLARARPAYERYAKLRPADPDGHYGLAETLRGLGEREGAIREYQLFVDLAKASPEQTAWVERARGHLAELRAPPAAPAAAPSAAPSTVPPAAPLPLPAVEGGKAEAPATAPQEPQGATAPAPPSSPERPPSQAFSDKIGAGDRAAVAGDHRQALFLYQDAVYLAPTSATARIRLARAYLAMRHPEKAEAQLRQVLELDPGNADALRLREDLKSPPPAASKGGATSTVAPVPPVEAAAVAGAAMGAAAATGARTYRFVPEAEPLSASPAAAIPAPPPPPAPPADGPTAADLYRAGVTQMGRREYARAVESFNLALLKDPTLAVAFEARASARFGLGRYPEAAQDYQLAYDLDPARASPLWGLAESLRLAGDRRAAEAYRQFADHSGATGEKREQARAKARELEAR